MADVLGRRRMFMLGLVLFAVASLAGGVAQSEGWLIARPRGAGSRRRDRLAGSAVDPHHHLCRRRRAQSRAGRVGRDGRRRGRRGRAARRDPYERPGLALGAVRQRPDRIAAAALAPRTLVESRAGDRASTFDFPGAVAVTAGLSLLVYAIVDTASVGWGSSRTLLEIGGAVILLVAFLIIESRQRHPLMPFSIFRLRTLRGADVVGLLVGMALFSMFFFISLYLQDVLHYSPIKTGIAYLPLAVGIIISAGVASRLVTRIGFKPTLIAGLLLDRRRPRMVSPGPAPGGSYAADVLGPSLLAAAGFGFAFVSVTIAAVTGTRPQEAGLHRD